MVNTVDFSSSASGKWQEWKGFKQDSDESSVPGRRIALAAAGGQTDYRRHPVRGHLQEVEAGVSRWRGGVGCTDGGEAEAMLTDGS